MVKQLMIAKKLEQAREALKGFEEEEKGFKKREEDLGKAIDEAKTDEEMDTVEKEMDKFGTDKDALKEKKEKLEDEIKKLEGELDDLNAKEPKQKRGKEMGEKAEVRDSINRYIRSKGQYREGFKIVDGGALVPQEFLRPAEALKDEINLQKYVRTVSVNRGSGSFPVIKKSDGKMVTVAELEQNPELAKPAITDVDFKIDTYRGYIPVSQEVIDDADYNIVGMIADDIRGQDLNTKNAQIAAALKTATAATAAGFDGLKDLVNVQIPRVYNVKAILSASMYNALDKLKDNNGRYLLQDSITAPSGKKLFGLIDIVEVLDDTVIGVNAGDTVGFIGDPYQFVALFDRKQVSVKWVDNNIYGQLLAAFSRFDVEKVDAAAGFYVTYTPDTGAEG